MKTSIVLRAMRAAGYQNDRPVFNEIQRQHRLPERVAETAWEAGEARRLAGLPYEDAPCKNPLSTNAKVSDDG